MQRHDFRWELNPGPNNQYTSIKANQSIANSKTILLPYPYMKDWGYEKNYLAHNLKTIIFTHSSKVCTQTSIENLYENICISINHFTFQKKKWSRNWNEQDHDQM
jgi:hypothetical protein